MMSPSNFANIEQALTWLLDTYPECRKSVNRLVVGYWSKVEGAGNGVPFDRLTNMETIVREARNLYRKRPDLSSVGFTGEHSQEDLFATVEGVFPGTSRV